MCVSKVLRWSDLEYPNSAIAPASTTITNILNKSADVQQIFKFTEITEQEIIKIIKSLKSSSCGVDGISAYFIKLAACHIAKPLANIINASFKFRVFPQQWKRAIVKPIPKINNPTSESEY